MTQDRRGRLSKKVRKILDTTCFVPVFRVVYLRPILPIQPKLKESSVWYAEEGPENSLHQFFPAGKITKFLFEAV